MNLFNYVLQVFDALIDFFGLLDLRVIERYIKILHYDVSLSVNPCIAVDVSFIYIFNSCYNVYPNLESLGWACQHPRPQPRCGSSSELSGATASNKHSFIYVKLGGI